MAMENVEIFFDKASKNDFIIDKLKKVSIKYQDADLENEKLDSIIRKEILPLAYSEGLVFTADELKRYLEKQIGVLNEENLEAVQGGVKPHVPVFSMLMTATLLLNSSAKSNAMFNGSVNSSPAAQTQLHTEDSEEKNVEGYDLVRDIKSGDYSILHFKHQKTGAQVVVCESGFNRLNVHFGIPAENNKGTKHVLEHCLLPFNTDNPYTSVNGHTDDYGISVGLNTYGSSEDYNILGPSFSPLMSSLCSPTFLSDKSVFDIESHMTYITPDGTEFEGGRVFIEETRKSSPPKIFDSKTNFDSGGIPSEIRNLSYEEVCDTCNKYVHPSNSLTTIELTKDNFSQYKEILERESQEYFNKFEKKDIEVDFDLDCTIPDYEYSHCDTKDGQDKEISAWINIDLRELNDSQLDAYRTLKQVFDELDDKFNQKVIEKGYSNCRAQLGDSDHIPKFTIVVDGKKDSCFTQENLTKLADELISDAISSMSEIELPNKVNDFMLYKNSVIFFKMAMSFAVQGDPFSEKYFTIENNQLQNLSFENIQEYQRQIMQNISAKKITVNERAINNNDSYDTVKFSLGNHISGDPLTDEIVLTLIKDHILYPNITRKGLCYGTPSFEISSENIYFQTDAAGAEVPYERYFFENEFNDLVKNFRVTQNMIDQLKESDEVPAEIKTHLDSLSLDQLQKYINNIGQ